MGRGHRVLGDGRVHLPIKGRCVYRVGMPGKDVDSPVLSLAYLKAKSSYALVFVNVIARSLLSKTTQIHTVSTFSGFFLCMFLLAESVSVPVSKEGRIIKAFSSGFHRA